MRAAVPKPPTNPHHVKYSGPAVLKRPFAPIIGSTQACLSSKVNPPKGPPVKASSERTFHTRSPTIASTDAATLPYRRYSAKAVPSNVDDVRPTVTSAGPGPGTSL